LSTPDQAHDPAANSSVVPSTLPPTQRRRWRYPLAALGLALALKLVAVFSPALVESVYSRRLYPYIVFLQSLINRWFGFSLAEILILAAIVGIILYLVLTLRAGIRRTRTWRQLLVDLSFHALGILGYGLLAFFLLWGLNYDRQPVAINLNLPREDPSDQAVAGISHRIIDEVNRNYLAAAAPLGPDGGTMLPMERAELVRILSDSYRAQSRNIIATDFSLGPPKPVLISRALTRMWITGVYNPFTGEPNYNREVHAVELPYVMAHEMAHQHGFAREDEANFIAFLICIHSENAYVRYSGYFHVRGVARRLADISPEEYKALVTTLGAGPRADIVAVRNFWLRFQGQTSVATNYVNDKYLKVNRVSNGTNNYLDSDELVVAYYLKVGW
jgi:hypothetical protein